MRPRYGRAVLASERRPANQTGGGLVGNVWRV